MSHTPRPGEPGTPTGVGPLAGAEPDTGRPVEDPATSDHADPRWDGTDQEPPAQPLANPDGTPNVLPSSEAPDSALPGALEQGTLQDQAARVMDPEVGRDNIREGRGGGAPNPALAEGGDG